MKRLGIFCTGDSEGIIDDYIIYLLQEMNKELRHLSVVCNGKLSPEGRRRLETCTADIIVCPKTEFDAEIWAEAVLRKSAALAAYDELVLFNDSFYGPLYPFAEIFDTMSRKPEIDFWSITVHGEAKDETGKNPYGCAPEHLQLYFLVIRSRMLHSPEFLAHWQSLMASENLQEELELHDSCFTKKFFDMGFQYAAYCDTREWEKIYDRNIDHCMMSTEILLKNYKCPILKKKVFQVLRDHYLQENYGNEPRKSLDFIKHRTGYNVELIWQNLLRNQNIAVTKANLGLDYILPDEALSSNVQTVFKETVIIAHLYYEDLMVECVDYLCNAPPEISLVATVSSEKKKLYVEALFKARERECEVRLVSNRGRDLSALLVGCADLFGKFKYLCFVHDKKSIRPQESVAVGREFFHLLWDNTLSSEGFIKNVLTTFEAEPNLGLLVPPHPYNGGYKILLFMTKYWSGVCFDKTVELAKRLGIPTDFISKEFVPLSIGSVFWCRTAAMKKIVDANWRLEDFEAEPMPDDGTVSHALERILPFAAQTEGFYTGQLITTGFARDEIENFICFSERSQIAPEVIQAQAPLPALPKGQQIQQFVPVPQEITLTALAKTTVPEKYWFLLKPVKNFLKRLGFRP